jgi:hypothetical protein
MIIRPAPAREYTSLPNAIFNDRRLSADTRTMIALVLSKPRTWQLRPKPLGTALSRIGRKPVGRKALARMFDEAMAAGYMARTLEQGREHDGCFGRHVYVVGMPDDVAKAITSSTVALLPQRPEAHRCEAHRCEGHRNQKIQNLENTDYKNSPPKSPSHSDAEGQQRLTDEELTPFGEAARDAGCAQVFVGSQPYRAWLAHRGADGMPPIDVVTTNGRQREVVWMVSLYPPAAVGGIRRPALVAAHKDDETDR